MNVRRAALPRLVPLLVAIAAAGCMVEAPDLATDDGEIVNGLPTTGYPSVVRVFAAGVTNPTATTPSCTGVLITSSSVLTAAHCVTNGAVHLTDVFSGTAVRHPGYTGGALHDIAVISTLDKVARPYSARLARAVVAGQPITLVGYGQTSYSGGQDGIKRYGTNTIDSITANFFLFDTDLTAAPPTEAATCAGDSGGPAFLGATDCVEGITKSQLEADASNACTAAAGAWFHTRVDIYTAWIDSVTRDPLVLCPK